MKPSKQVRKRGGKLRKEIVGMTHNHRFGSAKFSADLAWGSYPPKNGNSITLLPPEPHMYLNAKVSCFRVLAIIFHLAK
jgi:hypothetical protein